jgi:hypothetical protein
MAEDRSTLRDVDWLEVFPALRLFWALRLAINFRALVLAAIALAGVAAGWRVLGELFADPNDDVLGAAIAKNDHWPWDPLYSPLSKDAESPSPSGYEGLADGWERSPVVLAWADISRPFRQIFELGASTHLAFTHIMYLLSGALWSLLVWSFFGGAITRQAAVAVSREENVSWGKLASFVRSRLGAYFVAPLFPILGTFLAAAFLALLGFIMRAGVGVLIGGLVWPLVLLGGFMMAFLLIGLFVAWPLMWGAISAEGTDAFGALSHSYSYAYQRPIHYALYVFLAAVIGVFGAYVVTVFVFWIIQLSLWGITWGSGFDVFRDINSGENLGWLGAAGVSLIGFWQNCLRTLAAGFVFSYFWSASTVIYFLMRRLVDATEIDEIYMPEERVHGLPSLKTGPDGLPVVPEEPS